MFDWILNKLLVPDKSRNHGETDKKLVVLPGNASIQPGSIVMVFLLRQFENFTAIINNSLEKKIFHKGKKLDGSLSYKTISHLVSQI